MEMRKERKREIKGGGGGDWADSIGGLHAGLNTKTPATNII
jgi:hypothetical protein